MPSLAITARGRLRKGLLGLAVCVFSVPACAIAQVFDPNANYRIATYYGSTTHIDLNDWLAPGVQGASFNLVSCDASRSDYYDVVHFVHSNMSMQSNKLGHIHGPGTESHTACTVYGTAGGHAETKEFRFYFFAPRKPGSLGSGALTLSESHAHSIGVQVKLASGYVRLKWQKADGSGAATYGVARGATRERVLTISGLDADTEYQITAYQMNFVSFDLYRAGNSGAEGVLIPEGAADRKWFRNFDGVGKSRATLRVRTERALLSGPPGDDLPPGSEGGGVKPPRIATVGKAIISEAGTVIGLNAANCRVPQILAEGHAGAGRRRTDDPSAFSASMNRARLALSGGDAEQAGERAVWGCVDYTHLEGGDVQAVAWDGDVFEVAVGIEARLSAGMHAGLAVSRSMGSFDFADRTGGGEVRGEYDLRLTGVRPYLICEASPDLSWWASLGYGEGSVEIKDDVIAGERRSDVAMRSAQVGASLLLFLSDPADASSTTKLVLKGEAHRARLKLEGGDIADAPLAVDMQQFRLGLEGSNTCQYDADGSVLKRWLELSVRQDGGDAETSDSVEVGGGVRYINPKRGWTVSAQARALLEHERSRYEEYGATLVARKEPERDGRGWSLLLSSHWGLLHEEASGWRESGRPEAEPPVLPELDMSLSGRMGYGVWWPASKGLITWFGEFEQTGSSLVCLRVGAHFMRRHAAAETLAFAVFGEHGLGGVCPQNGIRATAELVF